MKPVQQARHTDWKQQNCVLPREFRAFRCHWSILAQSKTVGLTVFYSLYCPFSCFFSAAVVFSSPTGFYVNRRPESYRLYCCHPSAIIICRPGYIIIQEQGYFSLTWLQMKICVASGNEHKMHWPSKQKHWCNLDMLKWPGGCAWHCPQNKTRILPLSEPGGCDSQYWKSMTDRGTLVIWIVMKWPTRPTAGT